MRTAVAANLPDIFQPVVPEIRLNPGFKAVAESPGYAPARAAMRNAFVRMGLRDANFVEQFQTTGFDARTSELYLFAALESAGYQVTSVGDAPDFMVRGHGVEFAIEATTANPAHGGPPPELPEDPVELQAYIDGELAVRLGSALFSKLNKRYWELPHVEGKPLVLAVQSFASERAQELADTALMNYLYGVRTIGNVDNQGRLRVHTDEIAQHSGSKVIPSNFFALPDARHISAVLWTNSGTVAKFARMGYQQGLQAKGIHMFRQGARYVKDPDAVTPALFGYQVGSRWELWEEGLVMAHNPHAAIPLTEAAFPRIVHHQLGPDGLIRSTMPSFAPFASKTLIVVGVAQPTV